MPEEKSVHVQFKGPLANKIIDGARSLNISESAYAKLMTTKGIEGVKL